MKEVFEKEGRAGWITTELECRENLGQRSSSVRARNGVAEMGRKGKKKRKIYKKTTNRLRFLLIMVGKTRGEINIEILSPEMIGTLRLIQTEREAHRASRFGRRSCKFEVTAIFLGLSGSTKLLRIK